MQERATYSMGRLEGERKRYHPNGKLKEVAMFKEGRQVETPQEYDESGTLKSPPGKDGKAAQYQALHSSFFGIRGTIAPQCAIPLLHIIGMRASFALAFTILLGGAVLQAISMRDYRAKG